MAEHRFIYCAPEDVANYKPIGPIIHGSSLLAIKYRGRERLCIADYERDLLNMNEDEAKIIWNDFPIFQFNQTGGLEVGLNVFRFLKNHHLCREICEQEKFVENLNHVKYLISRLTPRMVCDAHYWYHEEWLADGMQLDMANDHDVELLAISRNCGSDILNVLETREGNIATIHEIPMQALCRCEYGFIVDFDEGSLSILKHQGAMNHKLFGAFYDKSISRTMLRHFKVFSFEHIKSMNEQEFWDMIINVGIIFYYFLLFFKQMLLYVFA